MFPHWHIPQISSEFFGVFAISIFPSVCRIHKMARLPPPLKELFSSSIIQIAITSWASSLFATTTFSPVFFRFFYRLRCSKERRAFLLSLRQKEGTSGDSKSAARRQSGAPRKVRWIARKRGHRAFLFSYAASKRACWSLLDQVLELFGLPIVQNRDFRGLCCNTDMNIMQIRRNHPISHSQQNCGRHADAFGGCVWRPRRQNAEELYRPAW